MDEAVTIRLWDWVEQWPANKSPFKGKFNPYLGTIPVAAICYIQLPLIFGKVRNSLADD